MKYGLFQDKHMSVNTERQTCCVSEVTEHISEAGMLNKLIVSFLSNVDNA